MDPRLDHYRSMSNLSSFKGKRINKYVYNYSDMLGKGNFAQVYKATNTFTSIFINI